MSPKLATVEVALGTDSDERTRVGTGGSVGPRESRELRVGGCGHRDGPELPSGETTVAVLQTRRCESPAAPTRRADVESPHRREDAAAGGGPDPAEIQWARGDPPPGPTGRGG